MLILQQATETLRSLVEQAKQTRLKQAHAIIVESERELLRVHGADQRDTFEELQSKLDSLRELLVRDPDSIEAITDAMAELKKVSPGVPVSLGATDTHENSRLSKQQPTVPMGNEL